MGVELADVEVGGRRGYQSRMKVAGDFGKVARDEDGVVTDEPLADDGKGAEAVRHRQAAA